MNKQYDTTLRALFIANEHIRDLHTGADSGTALRVLMEATETHSRVSLHVRGDKIEIRGDRHETLLEVGLRLVRAAGYDVTLSTRPAENEP